MDITVFTRSTCGPCKMLKMWLNRKGVNYNEVNIDDDMEAQDRAIRLSGFNIVPLTLIEKKDGTQEVVQGYNLNRLASII
jgi:glutaredoxin